ncbi:hypothetical protein [Streptomyces sp. B1I3]|uniref:hypothetical protein n=1 Tax=Streptomyces sp. B1I3 TaxID=3042264 RepID=UPI0027D85603|nr:hypothetical protein [Streptomyces sp. B1I3]
MVDVRTDETGEGKRGPRPFTVDIDAWPLSLDPYHVVDFNQALVLDALVDPLTREDPLDPGVALPSALSSLDPLDDGRTWLLRPAPGQIWDDGTPVRPQEIAAGIHRAWGPTGLVLPDGYATHDSGPGGGARSPVTARVVAGDGGAVTGRTVIEVRSSLALPYLAGLLAFPGAAPVREEGHGWTASGPYRPVSADRRLGRIELRRKPSRRTGPGTPATVVFQVHRERARALAAFDEGLLDLSLNTGLPPADFGRLAALPHATVRTLSMACQLWVRPGTDSVLDTAAGRRAFGDGFDREAVSARLQRAVVPLHRYSGLWDTHRPAPGMPDIATPPPRRLPPSGRRAELTLTYADFPPNDRVVAALAADIEARLGHRVHPRPLTYRAFAKAVTALDYELLYCINPAPLAHVAGYLTQFHSAAATGRALGLRDAEVDAALDRALRTPGAEASARAWQQAEAAVLSRAPVVPLFQVNSVTLHRPGSPPPAVAATGAIDLDRAAGPAAPHTHDRKVLSA